MDFIIKNAASAHSSSTRGDDEKSEARLQNYWNDGGFCVLFKIFQIRWFVNDTSISLVLFKEIIMKKNLFDMNLNRTDMCNSISRKYLMKHCSLSI